MKGFVETLKLITSEGRWLVTTTIFGIVVLVLAASDRLPKIDAPYSYIVWVVIGAGAVTGIYLLVGGSRAAGIWAWKKLGQRFAEKAADERALRHLEVIDYGHAQSLFWIVKEMGERFSCSRFPIHSELVDHGFLIFDDDETRYTNKTYLRVRKVIWEKVTAPEYKWRYRMSVGTQAPWLTRIY
jgi:hypothetical protein